MGVRYEPGIRVVTAFLAALIGFGLKRLLDIGENILASLMSYSTTIAEFLGWGATLCLIAGIWGAFSIPSEGRDIAIECWANWLAVNGAHLITFVAFWLFSPEAAEPQSPNVFRGLWALAAITFGILVWDFGFVQLKAIEKWGK